MRILMVGEIDAAGREIAARLYKENHKISWLTGPGKEGDETKAAGKVYRKEITYLNCQQIMSAEGIDTLFFLPPNFREPEETEKHWTPPFLNSILEALDATAVVEIKKIVYLSSDLLRQDGILSRDLEMLRTGERLCQSFADENRISCLIVRTGFLAAKGSEAEMGYLGYMLGRMRKKKKINTQLTAESTLDYVFGSDLADAVIRLLSYDRKGTYTVATGQPIKLKEFFDILSEATGYHQEIEYGTVRFLDNCHDSGKLRIENGWMPFYLFCEDGKNIISQITASEDRSGIESADKLLEKKKKRKRFILECCQNLLLFAAALCLQRFETDWSDWRFVDVRLAYVVIISISFGMRQGMAASALACLAYLYSMKGSGIDLSYILYSIESWIPFIVYGAAGAAAGYAADKRSDEVEGMQDELRDMDEKYQFLKTIYREVLEVKNQLQKQIMVSKDSFLRVYEISEKLDTLNPRAVLFQTLQVLEEIMESSSVVIYLKTVGDGRFGRTIACSESIAGKIKPSIDFERFPDMKEELNKGKLFVNRKLQEGYPSYAMPVIKDGGVVAVVCLYYVKFDKYTVYYRNMFQTVVQMVQNNLVRAYEYQDAEREKRYLEGTDILNPDAFEYELQILKEASEDIHIRFMTGRITFPENLGAKELNGRIRGLIRGTDLIGMDHQGNYHIVLINTDEIGKNLVEKRFYGQVLSIDWEE